MLEKKKDVIIFNDNAEIEELNKVLLVEEKETEDEEKKEEK